MARFSAPSNTRFFVFDSANDNYNHTEVAANWDAVDGLFGWPNSGVWPTPGQSIYSYIIALQNTVEPVGTLRMFQQVNSSMAIPAGTNGVPTANGFCIADGSTVTAGNHSFKDSSGNPITSSVVLPDYRNKFPLGANSAIAFGIAGTAGDGPTFAPGSMGQQGHNAMVTVNTTLPNHYHTHDHIHELGNTLGGGQDTGSTNPGDIIHIQNSVVQSSGQAIPDAGHGHNMDFYTREPVLPDDANYKVNSAPDNNSQTKRKQTGLQQVASGGTGTDPTGGSPGDTLGATTSLDVRPQSIGVFYLIKVKEVVVP